MEHNRFGEKTNTFWTQCHICLANFQYSRESVNQVVRCQRCYNIFEARQLEGVPQESLRNQLLNHKELPKQCPQSQEPTITFLTQCPFCSAKFRYLSDTLGLLLSCEICGKPFEAQELKEDVHPGTITLINQSSNPMEPSEQVLSNLASESNGGCKKGTFADFSGASNCEKRDVMHGVALGKHGVEMLQSGTRTSRHMNKKIGNSESGYSLKCESTASANSEVNGGQCRKYPSKRQNPSLILYDDDDGDDDDDDDDDDFVPPLKSLRKGPISGASKKKRNIAAAGRHKKKARKRLVSLWIKVCKRRKQKILRKLRFLNLNFISLELIKIG